MNNVFSILLLLTILIFNHASAEPLPDFVSIVKQNYTSVVNISTTKRISKKSISTPPAQIPGVEENTPLYDFLNYLLNPGKPKKNKKKGFSDQSLGSGFFISSDGYVLTNAHVVQDATQIIVTLSDHREFRAELVGQDALTDVALLKIDENNLPTVTPNDSDSLEIGQWVLAIGSPFGLDHTASQGIISGLGRSLPHESYVPFIQTDVAINPGNSGGPLFNVHGKVVGINSQIYTKTGGSIGLSFAIPINVALGIAKQIKQQGKVRRGWLGVTTQDLTQDLALSFGLKAPKGTLVSGIIHGSPSEEAGIAPGDIIVEYNNINIERSANLIHLLGLTKINTSVPIKLFRNGNIIEVNARITELNQTIATKLALAESGDVIIRTLNIKVGDLTSEQREYMKIPKNGVLIKSIQKGVATKAGIHKADVIVKVNNQSIENSQHFQKIIQTLPRNTPISVLIQRRTGPIFLTINLPG